MKNIINISLVMLFCCGCATKIEPYKIYSEKNHPLNDTAIFSVVDQSTFGGDYDNRDYWNRRKKI